jgi:putative endonuclease
MTNDVAGRVEKHNRGFGPEFTKKRRPVELIWSEKFSNQSLAREREVELKGWNRKKKLSLVVGLEKSGGNPKAGAQGKPFAGATGSRSG